MCKAALASHTCQAFKQWKNLIILIRFLCGCLNSVNKIGAFTYCIWRLHYRNKTWKYLSHNWFHILSAVSCQSFACTKIMRNLQWPKFALSIRAVQTGSCFKKNRSLKDLETHLESDPNLIWADQILCDLCCLHSREGGEGGGYIRLE